MEIKVASFYLGHNANACFYTQKSGFRIIELERLYNKRYYNLLNANVNELESPILDCLDIAKKYWSIDNDFDICIVNEGLSTECDILVQNIVQAEIYSKKHHHLSHAACSFYQSPYDEALVISYDAGGSDGMSGVFIFNRNGEVNKLGELNAGESRFITIGARKGVTKPSSRQWMCNLGNGYNYCAYPIADIPKMGFELTDVLAFAGKLMGLSAYGKEVLPLREMLKDYYRINNPGFFTVCPQFDYLKGSVLYDPPLEIDCLSEQLAADFAYNSQVAFEDVFFEYAYKFFEMAETRGLPIVFSGGCALNVILNEKMREIYGNRFFVAPNIDDGGLAFGQACLQMTPANPPEITYNGLPILDIDELSVAIEKYGAIKAGASDIAKLCRDGKIIGICQGDSEVGPRALGNRSIVCDPSSPDMQDTLNSKVKFREWFRPFAPFVREKRANEFFHIGNDSAKTSDMTFMSFAPIVRSEWQNKLPAVTHADGSARVQTVTKKSHSFFYELLLEFEKISSHGVLLNTSFNIRGKPILTRVADALEVLEETEIDHVYIEGYLFSKQ